MTRKSLPPLSITIRVMKAKDEPATTSQIVQNNCQNRMFTSPLYPTAAGWADSTGALPNNEPITRPPAARPKAAKPVTFSPQCKKK